VELVEINHVHRRAEFQIIISPDFQGKGLATAPRGWRWTTALPCSICISCI
jgi:hypothetical protein